jgi:hypothetical protein
MYPIIGSQKHCTHGLIPRKMEWSFAPITRREKDYPLFIGVNPTPVS